NAGYPPRSISNNTETLFTAGLSDGDVLNVSELSPDDIQPEEQAKPESTSTPALPPVAMGNSQSNSAAYPGAHHPRPGRKNVDSVPIESGVIVLRVGLMDPRHQLRDPSHESLARIDMSPLSSGNG
ncbi:hypothetical protein BC938DRAFT_476630, partial [Jimgerdemannia flammicorona]